MTGRIVAIVPAKDSAASIADTVAALRALADRVVVVDDGSRDATAEVARAAGATVLRLPRNRGKGGAVTAGVEATPEAEVYLLVDADTGSSAGAVASLLPPVLDRRADMTIGVLPGAGRNGGFGLVRRVAATGIRRATAFSPRAPLSGQRAVRADLLRRVLPLAPRFALETALTVDVIRAGGRVVEIDVDMRHRPTGRTPAGFAHRARQGTDVVRALWPRLTTATERIVVILLALVVFAGAALWSSGRSEPSSVPARADYAKVVVFGFPGIGWDDLPRLTNFRRLGGAVGGASVRTLTNHPSVAEAWTTFGAGARAAADAQAGFAFDASTPLEGGTAAEAMARRAGRAVPGAVVVVGGPATIRLNRGRHLPSQPGALGDALHAAGKRTAAVGNGDTGLVLDRADSISRPAAAAVMDHLGSVDAGEVGTALLTSDPAAPFGQRADPAAVVAAVQRAEAAADVVVVDPGDMARAMAFGAVASPAAGAAARDQALAATDRLLGEVAAHLPPDTLLLVPAIAPAGDTWHVEPVVAAGPGVPAGYLHSPSVHRLGIVTITDLAPTVLHAIGQPTPDGMIGHALRYHPGPVDPAMLQRVDRDANYREGYWFPMTLGYIIFQAAMYLLAGIALGRPGGTRLGRLGPLLRWIVLGVAAFPLASFVYRAVPGAARLAGPGLLLMFVIDAALVALALRARRHPLSPLSWILGATVGLLVADVATGARLQASSLLGYSLHTAARFTGIGNSAFAALAAATLLLAATHLHWGPRPREALVAVACLFAAVVLVDGAPSLGDDVGGILTLVPIFGVVLLVLSGRRLRIRTLAIALVATIAVLGVATTVDLLRPPEARTHLGTFAASLTHRGSSNFSTTVARKLSTNLRTYKSPWCWIVVILALYMLWVLGWRRGWSRFLPPGSALRVAVVATLSAGVLGNLLNDSGVVVTALVFVYIGPFLTLLALDGVEPAPELLDPQPLPGDAAAAVPVPAR